MSEYRYDAEDNQNPVHGPTWVAVHLGLILLPYALLALAIIFAPEVP